MIAQVAPNLFAPEPRIVAPVSSGFALRPYQHEDADAISGAWESGKRAVICRWATGAGKSVIVAEMAKRAAQRGRVLVVVDVTNLADDLASSIYHHTREEPGVLTGSMKDGLYRRIIIATVQSLYSGDGDDRAYHRLFDPRDFAAVLVDECETSLAEEYSKAIRYFVDGNPDVRLLGTSATPFRGDGRGMSEIYDHAEDEAGPLNRDILWCRDNGWLVNLKQGFVQVDVDFGSLRVNRDAAGDKDYSDRQLAQLLEAEADLRKLAHGIHDAANGEPGIVICPNSTDLADKLAGHLCAIEDNCARSVHGKQGKHADRLMSAYKRGEYQIIVSVNKLYKGFDSDRVKHVFMCRKTKSRRLYEQAAGRATRPLKIIRPALAEADSADERRRIIGESDKPFAVMWDLVGINEQAKDLLGVIDILNGNASEAARTRAKKRMLEHQDDGVQDTDEAARDAVAEEVEAARRAQEAEERRKRRLIQTTARVHKEITDDLRARGGTGNLSADVSHKAIAKLLQAKWDAQVIEKMTPQQVNDAVREQNRRWRHKLCTYKQAKLLRRHGYSREQLHDMPMREASRLISQIVKGGRDGDGA